MNRVICFSFLVIVMLTACADDQDRLLRKAAKIHERILTVDTHCDTPISIAMSDFDLGERHTEGCVDFPRMKEGGLDAEFFAVYTGQGPGMIPPSMPYTCLLWIYWTRSGEMLRNTRRWLVLPLLRKMPSGSRERESCRHLSA